MKIDIEKVEYQWSHGKSPKGNGRWFFEAKYSDGSTQIIIEDGSFKDACRVAVKKARGAWKLVVQP